MGIADGLRKIWALAVASEPEIFWRGDNADKIIAGINIPSAAGALLPASSNYNGPSGRVLDKYILNPLKFERYDAWLCDLIPYSLKNDNQEYALCKLNPFLQQLSLPLDTRRRASKRKIEDKRIEEIIDELKASKADLIITLGNEPIKYFINYFNKNILRLTRESYGQILDINIIGMQYRLLPLVHPRHIEGMSGFSPAWKETHELWLKRSFR